MSRDTNASWRDYALKERIEIVALAPEVERFLNDTARECWGNCYPEQAGHISGVVEGETFYALRPKLLAHSPDGEVSIPWRLHPADEEDTLRTGEEFKNFRTVLYHSHPKITRESLRKLFPNAASLVEVLEKEIAEGIWDGLIQGRTRPSIDEVLTETLTRSLSGEDVAVTPGNYHLLVTHTPRKADPRAYINFWHINPTRIPDRLVKVRRMGHLEMKRLAPVIERMNHISNQLSQELFGHIDLEDLNEGSNREDMWLRMLRVEDEKFQFYNDQKYGPQTEPKDDLTLSLA